MEIVGWDIGGVNIKAAWLSTASGEVAGRFAAPPRVASQPFEIWREKDRLPDALRALLQQVTPHRPGTEAPQPDALALTMTAELSDIFVTKRDGVRFVFESIQAAFPHSAIYALGLDGRFVDLPAAHQRPLDFAAANWLASALWIARRRPNCLVIDTGSTSTDILPILDGQVMVAGRTDLDRLASGELIYTGALRTNLAAIVQTVPVAGRMCRVASEYFAISGDVHLILGHLQPEDYTHPTPDGRPPTVETARRRLARLVCADAEMLTAEQIDALAAHIYTQQIAQIQSGIQQVLSRLPRLRRLPVIALGSGAFLARHAAAGLGLETAGPALPLDPNELVVAPCLAAAHLLAESLESDLPNV